MHTSPLEQIIDFNKQHTLFTQKDCLLVAVSGGADSTALLSMLVALKQEGHIRALVCVHFNHQLRDQANKDQAFVQSLANTWTLPFICETRPVKTLAQTLCCSIETAGRQWRMERLIHLAQARGCTAIATGHHQDDNTETLIHRLSRGTGYRGLCGIRPVRIHQAKRFISPLLALTRQDILAYLDGRGLTWCDDATNQDLVYTRNYIRQALLPALLKQHPKLTDNLRALSQACLALYTQRIEPRVQALFNAHVDSSQGYASVPIETLAQESTLVLVELMRHILTHLHSPLKSVTQSHYRALVDLVQGRATSVTLPGHMSVTLDQGQMQFRQTHEALRMSIDPLQLMIPGSTRFGNLDFKTRLIKASELNPESRSNRYVEYFDLQKLCPPLYIRQRAPGNRFVPLGKHTLQKVGKFLSRAQITGLQQDHVAILSDDSGDILWVCPVRMGEKAKITDETKEVLEVSVNIDVLPTA